MIRSWYEEWYDRPPRHHKITKIYLISYTIHHPFLPAVHLITSFQAELSIIPLIFIISHSSYFSSSFVLPTLVLPLFFLYSSYFSSSYFVLLYLQFVTSRLSQYIHTVFSLILITLFYANFAFFSSIPLRKSAICASSSLLRTANSLLALIVFFKFSFIVKFS